MGGCSKGDEGREKLLTLDDLARSYVTRLRRKSTSRIEDVTVKHTARLEQGFALTGIAFGYAHQLSKRSK